MKPFPMALSACLLSLCGSAHALTGNQLIGLLQSADSSRVWQAHAYVEAVLDTEASMLPAYREASAKAQGGKLGTALFCAPQGTTAAKVMELVIPKLQSEAATLQQNANILVRRSLIAAWPCAGNP